MVCYGKIIGGGLPVGAVAAKKEIMEHLAPVGNVYQAGTLSANPLAMVGGLETLKQLTPEAYQELNQNTENIVSLFTTWFKEFEGGRFSGLNMINVDSPFWIHPGIAPTKASEIPSDLAPTFKELFEVLLNKGIYLAPNAYEVGFVSLAHNKEVQAELKARLYS